MENLVFLTHKEIMQNLPSSLFYPCWKRALSISSSSVDWKKEVSALINKVVAEKHVLTKTAFISYWSTIKVPNDNVITKYLLQIKPYPCDRVLTVKQHKRLVDSLEHIINPKLLLHIHNSGLKPASKAYTQPLSDQSVGHILYYVPKKLIKLRDIYLKDCINLMLDNGERKLTSHLNILFQELLFNVEIYCSETLNDLSDYMLIREVLEEHGWKFDGYEGFSREPNLEKIKHSFNLIM